MSKPKSLQHRHEWAERIRRQFESGVSCLSWIPDFCKIHFLTHRLHREKQDKRDRRFFEGTRRKSRLLLPNIRKEFFQSIRRMVHESAKQLSIF